MKQFEVGKTYETTVDNFFDEVGITRVGQRFTCHKVDWEGDCWSLGVVWEGRSGLWCVAARAALDSGKIVEVTA